MPNKAALSPSQHFGNEHPIWFARRFPTSTNRLVRRSSPRLHSPTVWCAQSPASLLNISPLKSLQLISFCYVIKRHVHLYPNSIWSFANRHAPDLLHAGVVQIGLAQNNAHCFFSFYREENLLTFFYEAIE